MATSKDELRRQLNLKNLQRHDPSIDRIVASTSYASIYDNKGQGWVKTGVEGPMFLFSRHVHMRSLTTAPHYGFFVLNRNGLEYVQEFLTPESEVQVGGEFILYESGKNADRATGIWVFEEKERHELCRQMEQVRARAASSEGAKATAPGIPRGQPISIDMLFNSASPTPAAAQLPASAPVARPSPMNPLDALFASALSSPRTAPVSASAASPQAQNAQAPPHSFSSASQRLPSTLEQLFAAASPTPHAAELPSSQAQQRSSPNRSPAVGLANSVPGPGSGMALLDSIFASAAQNSSPQPTSMLAPAPPAQSSRPAPNSQPTPSSHARNVQPSLAPPSSAPAQQCLPASSPAPSQPRDARDLLAMLGGLESPPAKSIDMPWHAESEKRDTVPAAVSPKPQITVHPQGLSMDPQPGALGHAPTASATSSRTERSARVPMPSERPVVVSDEKEVKPKTASQTMFAPPVLSHDIFATLPLLGGTKHESDARTSSPAPNGRALAASPSEVTVPASSSQLQPPSASEQVHSSPSAPLSPTSKRSVSNTSLLISKADLISTIDNAVGSARVGLNGSDARISRSNDQAGPLSKEDFISRAMEVIQKPSFMTQLYGRYLERYEEQHE